jgi:hypothetical protein
MEDHRVGLSALRIEALQERLALANDRLARSAEDIEKLRRDLMESKSKATPFPVTYDASIEKLGNIAAANTATARLTKFTTSATGWANPKLYEALDRDLAHSPGSTDKGKKSR